MNGITFSEEPIKKLYCTIGELAKELGIASSAIRYWCKEFCVPVHRSHITHNRLFTEADRIMIREIYFLLYTEGFTLKGAKRKLENL